MKSILTLFLFLFSISIINAIEFSDGRIKLVIDERLGRFNIYYMTDVDKKTYEPLFWDKDKRTSFLSASVKGKEYKLGETTTFKTFVRGTDKKPVLAYESPFLSVTEEFSFIRTASSGVSNGIRIDIRAENWGEQKIDIGLRLLIDTFLGEKSNPNFRTDLRPVGSELVINRTTPDQYWLSRNSKYGLMGSIFVDGIDSADYLQFASWKRLSDARFKTEYITTRNFNALPFSTKDSGVCYYMEVKPMERWEQRGFTVLLAAEDPYGFDVKKVKQAPYNDYARVYNEDYVRGYNDDGQNRGGNNTQQSQQVTNISPSGPQTVTNNVLDNSSYAGKKDLLLLINPIRVDLRTLRELIYKVDEYIYSGNYISQEELKGMESTIATLKARYGAVFNTF